MLYIQKKRPKLNTVDHALSNNVFPLSQPLNFKLQFLSVIFLLYYCIYTKIPDSD